MKPPINCSCRVEKKSRIAKLQKISRYRRYGYTSVTVRYQNGHRQSKFKFKYKTRHTSGRRHRDVYENIINKPWFYRAFRHNHGYENSRLPNYTAVRGRVDRVYEVIDLAQLRQFNTDHQTTLFPADHFVILWVQVSLRREVDEVQSLIYRNTVRCVSVFICTPISRLGFFYIRTYKILQIYGTIIMTREEKHTRRYMSKKPLVGATLSLNLT